MGTPYIIFSSVIPAGLATTRYRAPLNAFPLGASAECKEKAVTAILITRATICERAPIVALTTKATRKSGFLVALCARDSVG